MDVTAMHSNPSTSPMATQSVASPSPVSLILLALKAGAAAALVAALLASRVPEPVIILGVIVAVSVLSWHRTQLTPARVRSQHRFTVVSRCGDGFVTIDSSGAHHVARRLVLGSPSN
jgi:xanthosine utilization system XapX-like protein